MHVESIEWFNCWCFQANILMITYIFGSQIAESLLKLFWIQRHLKFRSLEVKFEFQHLFGQVLPPPRPPPHPRSPHTPFSLSALVSSWFPLGSKSVLSLPPLHSHSGKTVGSSFSLWTKVWSLLLSSINLNHSHWPEKSPVLIGLVLD